jgi:tetratricopeptide (TPR) repeat protein
MGKRIYLPFLLGAVLVACGDDASAPSREPAGTQPKQAAKATPQSPAAFADWVKETRTRLAGEHKAPNEIEIALKSRLDNGRFVPDRAVMELAGAWTRHESEQGKGDGESASAEARFPQTMRVLRELDDRLGDRVLLRAKLRIRAGILARNAGDLDRAAREYEHSLALLTPLRNEVDMRRMETLVSLAGTYYQQGDKRRAEVLYLEAMSYAWVAIQGDPEAQHYLRDRYVEAGRGLIECRRGDRKALSNIVFYPATQRELRPALEAALKEAGEEK